LASDEHLLLTTFSLGHVASALHSCLLIEIQWAMIRAAQRVIFCFDSAKFGRRAVSALCRLERIHTIVTDCGAPEALVRSLRERDIEVVIASQQTVSS
jgi:DeoR/GlpR family transcriptional regulator of sugar metabolism